MSVKIEGWRDWARTTLPRWLFWSWNVIFVVFVTFGLLPTVLVHLALGAMRGEVPPDFAGFALALALIPPAAMAIAARRFRGDSSRLFRFFFGVEGPLMALCLFRLFLFRELTPATTHLGLVTLAGIGWYGVSLWRGGAPRSALGTGGAVAMHTLHALVGLYLGVLLSFFLPPIVDGLLEVVASLPREMLRMLYSARLDVVFFAGVGVPLLAYTGTLILGLPAALIILSLLGWRDAVRAAGAAGRRGLALAVAAGIAVLNVAVFAAAGRQPQRAAFALLDGAPDTPEAKAKLIAKAPELRRGLLNAYLGPYRYLATRGEADGLRHQYVRIGLGEAVGAQAQSLFNACAAPFLYDGASIHDDVRKAERLYEGFFDEPIQQAERVAIRHALASTYDRSQAEAGLVDRDAEIVRVERQAVSVAERGELADVELHEVYLNETDEQQEILYHFALPETAVLTGVWLGDTDDRRLRFPFQIAGKGAAQKVYRAEVARRADPALLEQVGPSSYRLRVFPIPPRRLDAEGKEPRMHLWLTYRTFRDASGDWPLPSLVEKRNAFWDRRTELTIDAKSAARRGEGRWLPASVDARTSDPGARAHALAIGATQVAAKPLPAHDRSLRELTLAVLVDGSFSMTRQAGAVDAALARLKERAYGDGADLVVAEPARKGARFYGNASPRRQLHEFLKENDGRRFDAIIMLTDDNGYERREDDLGETRLPAPLWLVHVGGALPPAVDDKLLLPWLASGGGSATGIDAALDRAAADRALRRAADAAGERFLQSDGRYVWSARPAPKDARSPDEALAAFGAARWIRARLVDARSLADNRLLNELAATHAVVTPLSSMIVLVNDQQRQALAAAAGAADAFDATAETGKELLTTPFASVSATPEPEEWALIALVVAFLLYVAARKREELAASLERVRF